ncbi:hypothetical protein [Actinacidiphila rubida]|uniref:Enoyl reductase n=1 Tax=Actinacidiphila rubida TaxID=310780 RepID=A0A1H8HSN2_9ACTN|nr:hypothetical protein [Actinacidiphila rubida]SEN59310.1 enoyl reductase [Actinacidiphila rubida]
MTARSSRLLLALAAVEASLLVLAWPSAAGPWGNTKTPPSDHKTPPPSTTITSEVRYERSYNGPGPKMAPVQGAQWSPPACWYEPRFTPKQFEDYLNSHYVSDQNAFADMARQYGVDNYHQGDKGAWWTLEVPDLSRAGECAGIDDWAWIPPGKPPADKPAIDPRTLAGLAYADTVLPAPPVTLKPPPESQLVNLATELTFTLPLQRVTVTASLNNRAAGVHVAATTVAEPYELRVDAGTPDADPATCTYPLTNDGGTYRLDTHGAPCNVTYRRASPHGGYTLNTSIVWKVHWTPSANPDGPAAATPALPDGESAAPTTVTVRENEAIVR